MKKSMLLFLLLHLTLLHSCLAQTHPSLHPENGSKNSPDVSYANAVAIDAVRDLYAYQSRKLEPTQDQVWVVAQVTPTSQQSQDPVFFRQVLDVPQYGDLRILFTLTGSPDHPQERYNWLLHFPLFDLESTVTRKDAFVNSAFSTGGVVICCINKSIPGQAKEGYQRYDPVYLLPPGYQDYVLPAYKFSRAHPGLMEAQNSAPAPYPQREKALRSLLHNSNPLLAVAAFRALVATVPVKVSDLKPYLDRQEGIPLALMYYALLKRALQAAGAGDEGEKLLFAMISSTQTPARLSTLSQSVSAAEIDMAGHRTPIAPILATVRASLTEKQSALN